MPDDDETLLDRRRRRHRCVSAQSCLLACVFTGVIYVAHAFVVARFVER
jgi:hypothetical protein